MALRITGRQSSYWDFLGPDGVTRVHFLLKHEQLFVSAVCDSFEVVMEHPVLLDYQEAWTSVYLASAPAEPEAVYEHLAADLSSVADPWRPSSHYFNDSVDALSILRAGAGLLVHAPQSVAARACAVLSAGGAAHTALPSLTPRLPAQALIAGQNFVVSRGFRVERRPN